MDSKDLLQKQSKMTEINTQINEEKQDNAFMNVGDVQENLKIDEIRINSDFSDLEAKKENPVMDDKIEKIKDDFKDSVKVYDKKKIKSVREQNIVDRSKFVSLYRNNVVVERDSEKMAAVKNAINRYLEHKGEAVESNLLETIIRVCDQYTSGKISFLRLGEAGRRLKEVKEVRKQADLELLKIRAQEKRMSDEQLREKRRERTRIIKADEEYYAPELDAHYRKLAAKTDYRSFLPETKVVINILRDYYPAMSFKEAEALAIRNKEIKLVRHDKSIDMKLADKLISKENKQSAIDRQEREKVEAINDRAAQIKENIPYMFDKLALRVAKKEAEIGKEYTDREIIAKYMGSAFWGPYLVQMADRKAIQNAKKSNIVHRFFSWITNYAFDKEEAYQEVLDDVLYEQGKEFVYTTKDEKTGKVEYDTDKHNEDYEDTFI